MKQKRYWLRGGIWFAAISLIVGFFLTLTSSEGGDFLLIFTHGLAFVPFILILDSIGVDSENVDLGFSTSEANITIVLLATIIYFIVGMFIGWLYGKFKNRNKVV